MRNSDHTETTDISAILRAPLTQGAVVGLLTLIPVRNYPRWLRRTIIWGPLVIAGVAGAYASANPQVIQRLSEMNAAHSETSEFASDDDRGQRTEFTPAVDAPGARRVFPVSLAFGAALSASMAVGVWADEAIDRGLRRLGIRYPRIVMGFAAGALTWWSDTEADQREAAES